MDTTNKPVAWIAIGDNTSVFFDLDCALSIDDNPTPLYTHPAKTLTDEEIISIADDYEVAEYRVCDFARAILRKAQEE